MKQALIAARKAGVVHESCEPYPPMLVQMTEWKKIPYLLNYYLPGEIKHKYHVS